MTHIENECAALCREEIFDRLGQVRMRAEAGQLLARLAHDSALDLALTAMVTDLQGVLFARQELARLRAVSQEVA